MPEAVAGSSWLAGQHSSALAESFGLVHMHMQHSWRHSGEHRPPTDEENWSTASWLLGLLIQYANTNEIFLSHEVSNY